MPEIIESKATPSPVAQRPKLLGMIGHANLGELRTYYRERAEDIAARAWG